MPANAEAARSLNGQTVAEVVLQGNREVSSASVLNVVRTRVGERLDPAVVRGDYQRIYDLRRFDRVEALVEPTDGGVRVIFVVQEPIQLAEITFRGNRKFDDLQLSRIIDLHEGEAMSDFRLAAAKRAIEQAYRGENYSFATVSLDEQALDRGEVIFDIVEGPNVHVRKIVFVGNERFRDPLLPRFFPMLLSPDWRLAKQISTSTRFPFFRPGLYDEQKVEDDVAAIRQHYADHGYFDARVGRKTIFSTDQRDVQVNFLIEEGPQYVIDRVRFVGNTVLSEAELRSRMQLAEGTPFNAEAMRRDVRRIIEAYSPFGYIYDQQSTDRDYLQIETRQIFRDEAGKVEVVYEISEGKPFRLGRIQVRGNSKTKDNVILREFRVAPGELYNAAAVESATEKLRSLPHFSFARVTPVGTDPQERDLLVEVLERQTASLTFGAGVSSNGGVSGNIEYRQRNFDINNPPARPWALVGEESLFSEHSFSGAGQEFVLSLQPGSEVFNASANFYDPRVLDSDYSFGLSAYLRDRRYREYTDRRAGGRVTVGRKFAEHYSALLSLRGEDIFIHDINDEPNRSFEIIDGEGHHTLVSAGVTLRRDTTDRYVLPRKGSKLALGWESVGPFDVGDLNFQRFTATYDQYFTLHSDLLDRPTILNLSASAGWLTPDAPFFERYYAGGLGSVRGFGFRGISPRDGPADDRIGGEFSLIGSAQLSYPLWSDQLRGVVFVDAGTVEPDVSIGTMRVAVGTGIRVNLPILGQLPLAVDFAFPLVDDPQDDTQVISFALGTSP